VANYSVASSRAPTVLLACPEVAAGLRGSLLGGAKTCAQRNRSPLSVLSAGGVRAYLFSYLRALLASDPS